MSRSDRERVSSRAEAPAEEELRTGSDDPEAQAEALLGESDERTRDAVHRDAAREEFETRDSDEATPPADPPVHPTDAG